MAFGSGDLGDTARKTAVGQVYLVPLGELSDVDEPLRIEGREVTALAPHPTLADWWYLTTGHPELLAFLPDPYVEL